jgi:hypothetical protein
MFNPTQHYINFTNTCTFFGFVSGLSSGIAIWSTSRDLGEFINNYNIDNDVPIATLATFIAITTICPALIAMTCCRFVGQLADDFHDWLQNLNTITNRSNNIVSNANSTVNVIAVSPSARPSLVNNYVQPSPVGNLSFLQSV